MSTLGIDKLQGSTNPARPPAVEKAEFVKAYGLFKQTAGTWGETFGVSSITDQAVGITYFNWTSPFAGTLYNTMGSSNNGYVTTPRLSVPTETRSDVTCYNADGVATDSDWAKILAAGALA